MLTMGEWCNQINQVVVINYITNKVGKLTGGVFAEGGRGGVGVVVVGDARVCITVGGRFWIVKKCHN